MDGWTDMDGQTYGRTDIWISTSPSKIAPVPLLRPKKSGPAATKTKLFSKCNLLLLFLLKIFFFFFQIVSTNPNEKQLKLLSNNYGLAYSKEENTATDIPQRQSKLKLKMFSGLITSISLRTDITTYAKLQVLEEEA